MNERPTTGDSTELVQRFIDQELSSEERVRFVAELGRSETLRRNVLDLERLILEAARLPRPAPPDGFVQNVMHRARPLRPSRGRVAELLWTPHRLQWNVAGMMGLAATLAVIVAGAVGAGMFWRPDVPGPATTAAARRSPVLVRLVVLQPGAMTVGVAGDFNGWNPERTPLERISDDGWAVTIPLEPGRYEYMFVVDDEHWIVDPFAVEQIDDGFGSRNAVLDVRPPGESPL